MSYRRKCGDKKKIKKLLDNDCYFIHKRQNNKKIYYKHFYLTGKRKTCKKCTNRIIRHYSIDNLQTNTPSFYRKTTQYWRILF